MATFGLVPGAGGDSWYWHRVEPELRRHGHDTVAVDLPAADDSAGLGGYVEAIVSALEGRAGDDLVLVAQSMAGLSAPLVCDHLPVGRLVLVVAMVPAPGESGGAWWANTGQPAAMAAMAAAEGRPGSLDPGECFFHDVPAEIAAEAFTRPFVQSDRPMADPWPRDAWPDVPTRFVVGRDDRLFPAAWLRAVVTERLGIEPDEIPGGHLLALANPLDLAALLHTYTLPD